ncbi:MAG: asparagine synthase (glutamine-hydrolyzing) [Phycisphaerae bacterium]|nr:asparagine synthase (glutamine-hydrolyzing) [Phycisphaerae bacterium]
MCGIAGYIGPAHIDDARLEEALSKMVLRGPDHRDLLHVEDGDLNVYLLHSRLSIIDLDPRANQPMTRDGCTLIYNGEIYNYRELRKELESAGAVFTTDSDTEVLLRAYIQYGPACVERFEGMWAFAIHDARNKTVMLSRDRFGEKPLYLLNAHGGLFFGSEPKLLYALSGERPAVNLRHLARYLVNGYKALYKTDELFFQHLRELPPSTNAVIDRDLAESRGRYWTPTCHVRPMSLQDAIEAVRERLIRTVELRLRADVPIAFCLSGGVDSGALASIAAKKLGCQVSTYSIIDRDERYDESRNVNLTVADLGCENESIEIPKTGALDHLAKLVDYHDAPVCTLSYHVHSFLSEAIAARGYKVVVSGTGADELFTGYYDHFNLHLYELRDHPDYDRYRREWETHMQPKVRNPHLRRADLYWNQPDFRGHIYLNNDEFAAMLQTDFWEEFGEARYCDSLLRNRMLNELMHECVPPVLHEDDLNSMRCSLENRSPYLDSELFDLAYSIPPEHLIRNGYGKYVLREAVAGILNDPVRLDRRKVGFNAAFRSVVDTTCPATRARLLDDGPVFDLVDRGKIEKLLDKEPLPNSYSKFLFSFVNAKLFLERFG